MKKPIMLLLAAVLFGGTTSLFPCDITMETARAAGGRDKVSVKLTVECIHKRCPVNIEKTALAVSGMVIEKQGPWKKTGDGTYQIDLIVSLNGKENGEMRVRRECPKTGHQEEILKIERI